ncbi:MULTISPECIES: DNA polymerase III subunit alpha [unclassified Breznakia]|uniref:DNA polymerase III subunit alpha n=1 Tax=unclassified Breznakia TaxID=2623764 RepID=UPI0024057A62|nr:MULTISPECIES: DNA polymerase III subunit alpha [unclassified Breznakia]MDF9838329.1 DNA polymerase-3 subunit alpha [Breznakia sp. PFB2-8]MDF9860345.1 DNA polymerase-3 subunit alpha [Breznakia sp. PH5-24]
MVSTHLHVRSAYTLLNSTLRIQDIISLAKKNGARAIALCDENIMHGAMAFYHACKKEGIKPIYGLEFSCSYNDGEISLIAYAKGDIGFQTLLKLSTRLSTNVEKITLEELKTYDQQMIFTTAGTHDELRTLYAANKNDELHAALKALKDNFNEFYLAMAMNDSKYLQKENVAIKQFAHSLKIKTFALSRIYFATPEDEEAYKVLCAIDQQRTLDDMALNAESGRYFRSNEEMSALYDEEDLIMSDIIADSCNVEMKLKKASLPVFKNRFDVDSKTYLTSLCKQGLKKRLNDKVTLEYIERLNYELDVICKMGYADYFLIVYDFIRFARSKDIYVGPGRGSAAGSLISYCLGITHVDPIEYNLLFERFLNPERISMPDIDIDFPDNRRDEVIRYVAELYGKNHVAHITTFGTLGAKQVLRDVGRVLGIRLSDVDMLCKMVPNVLKVNLDYVYKNSKKFVQVIEASKEFRRMYAIAKRLEGLPRHMSTHAGGIVLGNVEIDEVCPLIEVEQDLYSTQYTMEYLEELGLIKIDFLGLRNLTIIDEVCHHIKDNGEDIDIMKIPLNDKKTFKLLQDVDTVGIFQLESEGMKNLLRQMQVSNFEEIVAAIALFRPGPMENIPLYLKNHDHPQNIDYLHPKLKPILENTYGVMIYQEQVMQVTQIMANFSLGKADILRKAISKKIPGELEKLQKDFIKGSIENGYPKELAENVYNLILKFAGYGFNRSHSVAYGLIAYQLAYLKANYPLSFFASLLNSVIGSETKSSEYIFEAKKRDITILGPNVNESTNEYIIQKEALRFPLVGIKNIGSAMSLSLLEERSHNGKYDDFFDFVARISLIKITSKAIDSLIDAGALDVFNINRASMKASLEDAMRYASLVKVSDGEKQQLNFDIVSKPPMTMIKEQAHERSYLEKQVLGFYLSAHPITKLRESLNKEVLGLIQLHNHKGFVRLVGFIEKCKQHRTRNGEIMMFVVVSDETSKFDLVCMPNIYHKYQDILVRGNYIYAEGKISDRPSCLINYIELVDIEK